MSLLEKYGSKIISGLILKVLPSVASRMSTSMRDCLGDYISVLREKAESTDNPFDDLLVDILEVIFKTD